ncbi:MAG: energy transducer TonB [Thermodesulfobacteriota bacterium]|nr:energy transducer TonB [Thermodesulfobacteriota bacterium]
MAIGADAIRNRVPGIAGTGAIMRISLIISLILHLCMLLMIQKAMPTSWITKPLRTYNIELLRPPVNPLADEEITGSDFVDPKALGKPWQDETGDTISLDTRDERYMSYARIIKERLMSHWRYPRQAWENLIEGRVLVLFSLNRHGRLKDVRVLQPSACEILDQEALRSIRSAAPFPPFPSSVTVARLNIKANFAYKLTAQR